MQLDQHRQRLANFRMSLSSSAQTRSIRTVRVSTWGHRAERRATFFGLVVSWGAFVCPELLLRPGRGSPTPKCLHTCDDLEQMYV